LKKFDSESSKFDYHKLTLPLTFVYKKSTKFYDKFNDDIEIN